MTSPISDAVHVDAQNSLSRVILSGKVLLDSLHQDEHARQRALTTFAAAADQLGQVLTGVYTQDNARERAYSEAAVQVKIGALLVVAGRAAETGDGAPLSGGLDLLESEQRQLQLGAALALFYDDELLKAPPPSPTAEEALDLFKKRASQTLDNMVSEARDVVLVGIDKIRKTYHSFSEELAQLAESFVSAEVMPVIREGVQLIIAGLKTLAEFFKSDSVHTALQSIEDLVKSDDKLSLQKLVSPALAGAFGCGITRQQIEKITLAGVLTRSDVEMAEAEMAELSVKYVRRLSEARWILTGIGVVGGVLLFSGWATHYSAVGTPIAYAIVTVATILIGIEFADRRMRHLLNTLSCSAGVPTQ